MVLTARALSIHRVSLRRKVGRLTRGSPEYQQTLDELDAITTLLDKLNKADMVRIA